MGWDKPPTLFMDAVEGDIAERRTDAALLAYNYIVLRSPVDTGRFRANHTITYGAPAQGVRPTSSAADAFARERSALLAGAREPFDIVWIANNLPYALPLERGHSRQAPRGVYRISFEDVVVRFT